MTPTALALAEQLCDQAAELGIRLARAADRRGPLPAECIVHLKDALAVVRRAAEALEQTQATAAGTH